MFQHGLTPGLTPGASAFPTDWFNTPRADAECAAHQDGDEGNPPGDFAKSSRNTATSNPHTTSQNLHPAPADSARRPLLCGAAKFGTTGPSEW